MATKRRRMRSVNVRKMRARVPLIEYLRFSFAKDRTEISGLNERKIEKEIDREKRIAEKLEKEGALRPGNGMRAFASACKRRLARPCYLKTNEHSERVRRFSYCIAKTMDVDTGILEIIAKTASFHDIGKTLIARYLVNKEEGTVFGIGRGAGITKEELWELRLSHIEAGLRMIQIYAPFMMESERCSAPWIIGGHHIAYDGIGSFSGSGYYPEPVANKRDFVIGKNIPLEVRIVRCADVYSAILENRFYLEQSRRIVDRSGLEADDAALGLLIAVSGIDVDPQAVKHLIMARYDVDEEEAIDAVLNLACRRPDWLRERGGDVDFSLRRVIPQRRFLDLIHLRNNLWDEPMDTSVFAFV